MIAPAQPTGGWRRASAYALALAVIGTVANLVFSRMGFMPLDHSIVFDGGWRMLDGQVPWRDFVTPAGVVPSAMQAVFFAVFGVNWFAFCLHSSVVNGLFAATLFVLLAILRLPRPLAFFYSLCAVFFFYPPIGVPYMEQHSFFFTLAALTCAVAGNYAERVRAQALLWAAVPLLMLLAFFSKQVPFLFGAVALPVVLVLPGRSAIRTRAIACATSTAAVLALAALAGLALRVNPGDFAEYSFVRPAHVSEARVHTLSTLAATVGTGGIAQAERMGIRSARSARWLYVAALVAVPFVSLLRARRGAAPPPAAGDASRLSCALLLSPIAFGTSLLLQVFTNNQGQNALAFYPVSAGLLHAALCAELRLVGLGGQAEPGGRRSRAIAGVAAVVAVSIVPVLGWTTDTINFARNVDGTRMVNDLRFDPGLAAASAPRLPPGMEFVRWAAPAEYRLDGWADLVAFLRGRDGDVLIIGDNLVTYGLARKRSMAPNLWFHPGLSMPAPGEAALSRYEDELLARLQARHVRYIVLEGQRTWARLTVDQLPRFNAWFTRFWCRSRDFGENHVYERCAAGDATRASADR